MPLLHLFAFTWATVQKGAIVTGGTRGIGYGIASALASRGYDLLITYQDDDGAAHAAEVALKMKHNVDVVCVKGDLTNTSVRNTLFEVYDKRYANVPLRALVHNAGQYVGITSGNERGLPPCNEVFGDGSLTAEGVDCMHYYQTLYGDAYIDLCERAMDRMRTDGRVDEVEAEGSFDSGGGALIGISSPGCSFHYNPSVGYDLPGSGKCIMEYCSRLFAIRGAADGIRSNVVIPGVTNTGAWERLEQSRGKGRTGLAERMASRIAPMGTMEPADLGESIAWLCGPAGKWITGLSIPIDGGVHLNI